MSLRIFVHALTVAVFALAACRESSAASLPHMGTTMTINGRTYGVYIENDVNERVASFNKDILRNHLRGHIVSCSLLIDLPVGVVGGNHSYGGYCELADPHGRKSLVEVCDAYMTWDFELAPADAMDDRSENALAKFVAGHCYGG